jgi:leader peptidase (prepilin peptidase)/N-methyltransferase
MIYFFVTMAFILGLLLGSFLNALAYRLPRRESLMTRSHCTQCFKQISAWENIPVISWLVLRGRCSGCKTPISVQYPLVEFGTAVAFALLVQRANEIPDGFAWASLIFLSFAFVGVLISLIDLDLRRIPTDAVWSGLILALIGAIGYSISTGDSSRAMHALLFMAVYFIVYFVIWLFWPRSMGYGDVRLSALTGFVLGWVSVGTAVLGFFLPFVVATIWLIPAMLKGDKTGKTEIPFGPWMILGTLLAIVFGDILVDNYLQLGGMK